MAKIDIAAFREREEQKYITARTHPTEDLIVWNYTAKCMYEPFWDAITEQARGLITTFDGTVVARPFSKFFSIEEMWDVLPDKETFTVTEKVDGSLGILHFINGEPCIATRGSFTSEQAIRATKILYEKYSDFIPFLKDTSYYTYLFEILYPENCICVDYGDIEDLVLLAIIHTETGHEYDIYNPRWRNLWPFPLATQYDGIKDYSKLKDLEQENQEGFVVRFESGFRVKVKFENYKRLHKIITQCTARTIWEYLRDGKPLAELLDRVPPEFERWVKKTSKELSDQYRSIFLKTSIAYKEITKNATIPTPIVVGESLSIQELETFSRAMKKHIKEQFSLHSDIEHFLLMMYAGQVDGKRISLHEEIWKTLRPEAERPFISEEEVV